MTPVQFEPLGRAFRHLQRYRHILAVLIHYGFEDVLHALHIEKHLGLSLSLLSKPWGQRVEGMSRAERVRHALEDLGPAFVKVGQFLSTRADILGEDYLAELARLQDRVPPFPAEQARAIVERELGAPLSKVFASFEGRPFAAASIGQAHRARMLDGREAVVKVQRPGLRETVAADLEILMHLASLADRHLKGWENQRATRLAREWSETLERELDYTIEASHMERFAREFEPDKTVRVPRVYREALTPRVLAMEWVAGTKISDFRALEREGIDRRALALRAGGHMLKAVFLHGFFHADPHPGNLLALPDAAICYLDFGMTGRLDARLREALEDMIAGLVRRDEAALAEAAGRLSLVEGDPDRRALERSLAELVDQNAWRPLREVRAGKLLQKVLSLCSQHRLVFPPELFLLAKALANLEGLVRALDPEVDALREAAPFVRELGRRRLLPAGLGPGDLLQAGEASLRRLRGIPGELRELLHRARLGHFRIEFEHKGLEPMLHNHDQVSNRLSFAIVLASLVIGSSLLVVADIPPHWHGLPVVGLSGYLLAAVMGFWLLLSILRHGRL